ncbi:MAG: hypothetical protein PHS60_16250 [Zavarzinia sp.]|nr:hypothetical protein [Zavarzinia sp.]
MRYNNMVHPLPGHAAFEGTPEESNRIYEDAAMPIAIAAGAFPLFAGNVHEENLTDKEPAADNWDRVLLMRYPNRRAFLELVSDPAYGQIAYYKLAALKVALVPAVVEMSVPDVRLAVGALLLGLFLAVGWWRAAIRRQGQAGR